MKYLEYIGEKYNFASVIQQQAGVTEIFELLIGHRHV